MAPRTARLALGAVAVLARCGPRTATRSFRGESFDTVRRLALVDGPDDQRVATGELEIGITYRETHTIAVYDPDAPRRRNSRGVPTWVLTGHCEPYESSA